MNAVEKELVVPSKVRRTCSGPDSDSGHTPSSVASASAVCTDSRPSPSVAHAHHLRGDSPSVAEMSVVVAAVVVSPPSLFASALRSCALALPRAPFSIRRTPASPWTLLLCCCFPTETNETSLASSLELEIVGGEGAHFVEQSGSDTSAHHNVFALLVGEMTIEGVGFGRPGGQGAFEKGRGPHLTQRSDTLQDKKA